MVTEWKKSAYSALDRILFIGIGVIGTIVASYITGILKDPPPKLIASQTFIEYQSQGVPAGSSDKPFNFGIFRVDIDNKGKGVAENVKLQVKFPPYFKVSYYKVPNFRVYDPKLVEFKGGEFYLELPRFPKDANAFVVFKIDGNADKLCETSVKIVSETMEGEVKGIEGMDC